AIFLQAVLWFPFAALALLSGEWALGALLVLHVFITAIGAFVNPLWTAWISEWVPRERMGRYFGLRNKISGFTVVSSTFLGGLLLGVFQDAGLALLGFAALFILAGAARLVSGWYFTRSRERRRLRTTLAVGSIWPDLSEHPLFNRVVQYSAAYTFCVQLAAPFFVVYLLDDLGIGYPAYAAILTAAAFASYLSMPYWGKLADRFGSKRVLGYTALAIPLVPLAYLVPPASAIYYLIVDAFSGMLWAGQKLATFNRVLEYSPALRRPRFVAVHNLGVGLATFAGALVGGGIAFLVKDLSLFGIHGLMFLFLLSGVLRIVAALYFVPRMPGRRFPHSHRLHTFFRHVTSLPVRSMYI
ncbi:MAG: MFS transporter, partial [Candidatus Micrarchaeota archaeon]|nr:MFS transporter [Candidatus Micrarchaeota archaeon]